MVWPVDSNFSFQVETFSNMYVILNPHQMEVGKSVNLLARTNCNINLGTVAAARYKATLLPTSAICVKVKRRIYSASAVRNGICFRDELLANVVSTSRPSLQVSVSNFVKLRIVKLLTFAKNVFNKQDSIRT